jgi:hypothetical protein
MSATAGDLQTAIWHALNDHGHTVSTAASRAAAEVVIALTARGIAQADLDRFAPPPRPPLMADLHEHVRRAEWGQPGLLAAALRRHADRLDAIAHRAMLEAGVDAHAAA